MTSPSHAYLHNLEGLDLASVLDMRASAEIDKGSATVDGAALASDELVNVVQLIFAVCEHLLEVLLGDLQSVEALLLFKDARRLGVERLPVSLTDNTSKSSKINIGKVVNVDMNTTYPSGMAMS
jgi:hypothetical protein